MAVAPLVAAPFISNGMKAVPRGASLERATAVESWPAGTADEVG